MAAPVAIASRRLIGSDHGSMALTPQNVETPSRRHFDADRNVAPWPDRSATVRLLPTRADERLPANVQRLPGSCRFAPSNGQTYPSGGRMRCSLVVVGTFAVAFSFSGIGVARCNAQRATLDRIMHSDTLDNGLQVIIVENHSIPIVTAEIVFRAGAMTQAEEDQGVPHLFEHMLFRSYRGGLGEPFSWDAAKERAAYNGATSDEDVLYFLVAPSANTNDALGTLARLVRDAHFENADFQRERFIVMNEAQRDASDPQFNLERETDMRLWGDGFPRKNAIGDEMSLMSVTIPQLTTI